MIQERVKAKLVKNRKHAHRALFINQSLFQKMYGSLSTLANVTSDSVCVYLKLFSVTDANQQRLVRSKMSSIFKPSVRRALNLNTSQGIFDGVSNVLKNLEESKKINTLVKSSLLQTKKAGKTGRMSGKNKGKKPEAGGPRPKAKKALKIRRPVKRKPRRTLTTLRTRRPRRRRKRKIHVIW